MENSNLYPPEQDHSAQRVKPGIQISPELNPSPQPVNTRAALWKIIAGAGGLVVIIVGFSFFGYSQGYSVKGLSVLSPNKIWEKFYAGEGQTKTYSTQFKAEYQDPDSLEDPNNELGIVLKNIKLNLEGNSYVNLTEPTKPEFDGTLKFSATSGNTSFSSGIDYRALNGKVFYNIGDIPFLSGIVGPENKDVDWVKIDLEKAKQGAGSDAEFFNKLTDPSFEEKIRQIWVNNKAIKIKKYVGREKINNYSTLHFKADLDKATTKKAAIETIYAIASLDSEASITNEDKELLEFTIEKLVAKIEVKSLDIWVGANDYNLYKLNLVSNAPSFISFIRMMEEDFSSMSLEEAQQKKEIEKFIDRISFDGTLKLESTYSNYGAKKALVEPQNAFDLLEEVVASAADAKRLADARQIASALELYYNDNNDYPQSLSSLVPNYIGEVPTAPNPPDGSCNVEQNSYVYTYINSSEYKMTFCLGKETAGLGAGVKTLSHLGIN